jgi:hypothetical protein
LLDHLAGGIQVRLAALLLAASCAGPQFLGERLPRACASSYAECQAKLQLAPLRDEYDVAGLALHRYVERVTARIVHASSLDYMPEVVILETGEAEVFGRSIVVGRTLLSELASEAQLAGVIAHETAHLEARDGETPGNAIDAEAIADERAVALLARAGYPPDAIARALGRLAGDKDDPSHPPTPLRIERTRLLADVTPGHGDEGRAAYLRAIDGLAVGTPRELGDREQGMWIVADRDLVVPIPADAEVDDDELPLVLRAWRGGRRFQARRVGVRVTEDAITALRDVERRTSSIGELTIGRGLPKHDPPDGSLARLLASMHSTIGADAAGAVVRTPGGGVVMAVTGPNAARELRDWLGGLRAPTAEERARATSPHIRIATASHAGTVRELVTTCANPAAALQLDEADRVLAKGELFKCTDR